MRNVAIAVALLLTLGCMSGEETQGDTTISGFSGIKPTFDYTKVYFTGQVFLQFQNVARQPVQISRSTSRRPR